MLRRPKYLWDDLDKRELLVQMKKPAAVSKREIKPSPRIFDERSIMAFFNTLSFAPDPLPGSDLNKVTAADLRSKIQDKKVALTKRGKVQGCIFLLPQGSGIEDDSVVNVPWSQMKSAASKAMNHEKILLQKNEDRDDVSLVFIPEKLLNAFGLSAVNQKRDVIPFRRKSKSASGSEPSAEELRPIV